MALRGQVEIDVIIANGQDTLGALALSYVNRKSSGVFDKLKLKDDTYRLILLDGYLRAVIDPDTEAVRQYLVDDDTKLNQLLDGILKLSNRLGSSALPITGRKALPLIFAAVGLPGTPGIQGNPGAQGATGLATDFQTTNLTSSTVADQFLISDAKGARWDYVVVKSTGEQRSGSVLGTWTADGANIEFNDTSTDDILGTTEALEFNVIFSGGNIQLVAVPASGQWSVYGSRYFTPNNGNGTGPISGVLADGYVFIGNSLGVAQARLLSGAISVTNTGVVSIGAGVIVNSNINASAAIAVSKLAAMTASRVVGTDASGFLVALDTATYPSLTELALLKGVVTTPVQTQINGKLTDPMTSIGDVIIRNGSNVTARLAAGSSGQVFTISGGVPSWQTPVSGFADPLTSVGDLMHRNSGNVTARLGIGSANQVLTVSGGLPVWATPASGFADPMTTIGDLMIRNGSNVTSRLGIGTSAQILTVSGGVPTWQNIPSNYITGSLVAGRVTLSTGTNTIGDNSGFTWSAGMLTTGKATLSTTPAVDATLTQILARDGSTGEIKYRNISTFSNGNYGGWGPVNMGNVTLATNVTNVTGTGSYSIVGEIVHVFGYLDVTPTALGTVSFSLPLAIPTDALYGGGGEATIGGVGSSLSTFNGYNIAWSFRYNASAGSRIFVETESQVPGTPVSRIYFTYTYRRIAV